MQASSDALSAHYGPDGLIHVKNVHHFNELKKLIPEKGFIALFWAEWHPPCHQLKDMMTEMAKIYKHLVFAWVNSDEAQDLVDKLDVSEVPALVVVHPHKLTPDLLKNPLPEAFS